MRRRAKRGLLLLLPLCATGCITEAWLGTVPVIEGAARIEQASLKGSRLRVDLVTFGGEAQPLELEVRELLNGAGAPPPRRPKERAVGPLRLLLRDPSTLLVRSAKGERQVHVPPRSGSAWKRVGVAVVLPLTLALDLVTLPFQAVLFLAASSKPLGPVP